MLDILQNELFYLLRVLIAGVLGFAVGIERKMRLKEAGIRTHAIVSIGSCLMMLISKYGFTDVGGSDGARLAAQVVSGIGFLGAGMIIYKREALRGLTTAAGVWTTAGIGMCVGAGMYFLSVGTTLLVIIAQYVLHYQFRFSRHKEFQLINITFISTSENIQQVKEIFAVKKFLKSTTIRDNDKIMLTAILRSESYFEDEVLNRVMLENVFISRLERGIDE